MSSHYVEQYYYGNLGLHNRSEKLNKPIGVQVNHYALLLVVNGLIQPSHLGRL